ncbi:BTB/POZ and MATH domain-containing protein 1-like [Phragmites australis]|uniref:BTB/POZ and MATH domain-containing protein 1-like n=1 Tax=Phragmites australis TaxID=29695 RepID=UPI002D7849F7|nr:BTB/POZ and MATH domain-containing protein 1-like [Phragmites australis]
MATTAVAARGPRSTVSTIVMREVRGQHTLVIDGCAPSKDPQAPVLVVADLRGGGLPLADQVPPRQRQHLVADQQALHLPLPRARRRPRAHRPPRRGQVQPARPGREPGGQVHPRRRGVRLRRRVEVPRVRRLHQVERSGGVGVSLGNRFSVRCDVSVIKDWVEDADAASVPPPDLHEHLYDLLWRKQGADVMIDVGGETFHVHRWLLAARSQVFEAELLAGTKEEGAPGVQGRIEIQGVEPRVFRAVLRFLYTDSLPRMEERDAVAMAQGLLAVAHRYKLERLKPMCEEILRERIGVDTVAGTLAVAEQLLNNL